MRGPWRWILRGFAAFLLLLVVAGIALYVWQRGSLPDTEGTLTLHGLKAPVTVTRDRWGIPTIRAESEADAVFALGFVHAQDRLFQMDFTRRLGAGRLSEVTGAGTVAVDRFMRTLGLYGIAKANLKQLSPEARAALESYAAGVNAYIDSHSGPLPMEFYLLAYRPAVWTAADSLVWGRLMALQLSGNYGQELLRAQLASQFSPQQMQQLFPPYPADAPIATQDRAGLDTLPSRAMPGAVPALDPELLRRLADALPWSLGPKSASNAWALAPARSTTGGALLANDPHLGLQEPGYWYLARLEFEGRVLAGATAPGVPYMVIGRNDTLAWSFTTTQSDTQDFFVETIDPSDPTRYLTKDGPRAFETREETISIDGASPLRFTVRSTYHGPVMNDALPETGKVAAENQVLALAWAALSDDDRSGEALFRLNRAGTVAESLEALRDLHSPQQSMILADAEGHITLIAPARVPIRAKGDGTLPVPGAGGEYDWTDFVPFEELPRLSDPTSGQLVTANNKAVADDYPHLIAAQWYIPSRAQRIVEMLQANPVQSPQDMAALQYDSLSIGARKLLPTLLSLAQPSGPAADLLAHWNYVMDRNRPEPLIYNAWVKALMHRLLADQAGEMLPQLVGVLSEQSVQAMIGPDSQFCDDTATQDRTEDCATAVRAAFDDALQALGELYGDDPGDWRWGEAHVARFDHQVLQYVPVLGDLVAYELPADGGQDTVNAGGTPFYPPMPLAFRDRHGPGLRAVFDMANPDGSLFVIATGQSGNPLSPHYGDLAPLWQQGQTITLPGTPVGQGETLTLNPR